MTENKDTHRESVPGKRARHSHKEPRQFAVARTSWHDARQALLASPRGLHVLLLLICFILGFALVVQVQAQRADPVESLSEEELVLLLNELTVQEDNLRGQRGELQSQLTQLQDVASRQEAANQASKKAQEQAAINAGTVPVTGEGIIMTVSDPDGGLSSSQFVMTLGELRNAGAEAIELNGVRLSTRSSFTSNDSLIVVDGQTVSSPYQWKVIGSAQTISTALEIKAGSAAQMRAKGAYVSISQSDEVVISSLSTPLTPQFASIDDTSNSH